MEVRNSKLEVKVNTTDPEYYEYKAVFRNLVKVLSSAYNKEKQIVTIYYLEDVSCKYNNITTKIYNLIKDGYEFILLPEDQFINSVFVDGEIWHLFESQKDKVVS